MIIPKLNPDATRTYQIIAPLPSHFRPATCAEVECKAWASGWITTVLPGTPEHGQVMALRGKYSMIAGRRELKSPGDPGSGWFVNPLHAANEDGTVSFEFAAGQQCFRRSQHRKSLEREPFYRVKDGMSAPTARRADDWVSDFAEHQQMIADARTRG
jgi:hypothetical protein